jgi:hypothetical protein
MQDSINIYMLKLLKAEASTPATLTVEAKKDEEPTKEEGWV